MVNMIKNMDVKIGILNIQFFVKKNEFYAYDPGFRFQGEAPDIYVQEFLGKNVKSMMIDYAVNNQIHEKKRKGNKRERNIGVTIWVLLKSGKINAIKGLSQVESLPFVINVFRRVDVGDVITDDMIGTEKQVGFRIYTKALKHEDISSYTDIILGLLQVLDENDNSLITAYLDTKAL